MVSMSTKFGLASGFGLVTGYIDVIVLIRYSVFASMMTGNLLQLGKAIADPKIEYMYIISIIVCRMLGLAMHHTAERKFNYGTTLLTPLLILLVSGMEIAHYVRCYTLGLEPLYPRKYEVLFIAPVFGVQECISLDGCLKCPTTVATGHLQNITGSFLNIIWRKKVDMDKFILDLTIVGSIALGALFGSRMNAINPEGTLISEFLLTPAVLLIAVLAIIDDRLSSPEAHKNKSMMRSLLEKAETEQASPTSVAPSSIVVDAPKAQETPDDESSWFDCTLQ